MDRPVRVILIVTTLLNVAVGLVVNYASVEIPKFFADDPWRVWFVLGLIELSAIIVALLGADNAARKEVDYPAFGNGNQSFQPPSLDVVIRGRKRERWRLRSWKARGLVVLSGPGGMGKTTLAKAAAAVARSRGRRVHWIRFRDEEELAGMMLEVAKELGLKQDRIVSAQRAGASLPDLVWRHLGAFRHLGWMIVLDDVDVAHITSPSGDPVAEYRGWIRPPLWGLLLVTSRNRDRDSWGRRATVYSIGRLEPKAAARVLLDLAPAGGDEATALRLARRLGCLPLALQAAALAVKPAISRYPTFDSYREALEEQAVSLLPDPPDVDDPGVLRRLIGYTWKLSLDQLSAESLVLAHPLMRLLTLCADAPIPREIISASLVQGVVDDKVSAAAVDGALAGLHRYGLIEADVLEGNAVVSLHPVVRESMAALLGTKKDMRRWRRTPCVSG